ncbi:MAG: transporter substrate-binding domain-containing protein [Actinomycetes bacterium]
MRSDARLSLQSRRRARSLVLLLLAAGAVWGGVTAPSLAGAATTTTTMPTAAVPVSADAFPRDRPVRVAVRQIPPFDIKRGNRWSGYSIDLWRELAGELGIRYEFVEVDTVQQQLAAVFSGMADTAIGAISITSERERALDFSQPIYDSGMQIMTSATGESPRMVTILKGLFSRTVLAVLMFVIFLVVVTGHIIWLVERRRNPDEFPRGYVHGVEAGMWWAIVTLSTVGYGDKTAQSKTGRVVAVAWMILSIVLLAEITAVVTSQATVERLGSQIESVSDLNDKKVVTVRGTAAQRFVEQSGVQAKLVDDVSAAEELLLDGDADAVVYDAPVLDYFAQTEGDGRVKVVGPLYDPQGYGIALPDNSPALEPVNAALLMLREDGTLTELQQRWFGN